MKLVHSLFLTTLCLLMISCGGAPTSSAKFFISSSMLLNNQSYSGGLMIQGSGPNSIKFSKFIPYNASSTSNSFTLDLPKGTWSFRALGWAGPTLFSGAVKCGRVESLSLTNDTSSVNLAIDSTKCDATYGSYSLSAGNFKNLKLVTCNQIEKADGLKPTTTGELGYCSNSSPLYASAKRWARSAMIFPLDVRLDKTTIVATGMNECLEVSSEGIISNSVNAINLPGINVPFVLHLFEGTNCSSGHQVMYPFPSGWEEDYRLSPHPEVKSDKSIINGSADIYLVLSTSPARRSFSSIATSGLELMPKITCTGASCVPAPALPAGIDYIIESNSESDFLIRKDATPIESCTSLAWTPDASLDDAGSTCREEIDDGIRKIFLRIKLIDDMVCLEGTPCTFTYNIGAGPQVVNVAQVFDLNLGFTVDNLIRSLGHFKQDKISHPFLDQNVEAYADESSDFGRLSIVSESLGPGSPLALAGQFTCSSSLVKEDILTIWEDNTFKTYRVKVNGLAPGASPVPSYICNDSNPNGVCTTSYQLQVRFQKLVGVEFQNDTVAKLHCSRRLGELEIQFLEEGKESERIYWNTEDPAKQRYEYYSFQTRTDASGVVEEIRTLYERAEKMTNDQIRMDLYEYSSIDKGSANFHEQAYQRHISLDRATSKIGTHHKHLYLSNPSGEASVTLPKHSLFQDSIFRDFEREPSAGKFETVAFSPDKVNVIRAKIEANSIKLQRTSPPYTPYSPISAVAGTIDSIALDVNNSNQGVLCWRESGLAYASTFDGTNWSAAQPLLEEVHRIEFSGTPTSGSFDLSIPGFGTKNIAFNDTAAIVESKLRLLANLENIIVRGDFSSGFLIRYPGYPMVSIPSVSNNTLMTITAIFATPIDANGTEFANHMECKINSTGQAFATLLTNSVNPEDTLLFKIKDIPAATPWKRADYMETAPIHFMKLATRIGPLGNLIWSSVKRDGGTEFKYLEYGVITSAGALNKAPSPYPVMNNDPSSSLYHFELGSSSGGFMTTALHWNDGTSGFSETDIYKFDHANLGITNVTGIFSYPSDDVPESGIATQYDCKSTMTSYQLGAPMNDTGCSFIDGSFAAPVHMNIFPVRIESLNPGIFKTVFTPAATFIGQ